MILESTRRKCKRIRDRYYPPELRLGSVIRRAVMDLSGPDHICLELGCGRRATFLRSISEIYALCLGVDVEVQANHHPTPRMSLICADAHKIPLRSGSVDVVIMLHVIEHLMTPQAVLRECARVLRPGGRVIILTVNKWFPPILISRLMPHRLRQILNRLATGTEDTDTFPAYYRANVFHALNGLAHKTGLTPAESRYWPNHPEYLMFSVTLYRLGIFFQRLINRFEHLQWLNQYLYVVYQKQSGPPCHPNTSCKSL